MAEVTKITRQSGQLYSILACESNLQTHQYYLLVLNRGDMVFQSGGDNGSPVCKRKYHIKLEEWPICSDRLLPHFYDKKGNRYTFPGKIYSIKRLEPNDQEPNCRLFDLLPEKPKLKITDIHEF